jgi:peptidoglycan/LPS O-acetylase OafA/YrhL
VRQPWSDGPSASQREPAASQPAAQDAVTASRPDQRIDAVADLRFAALDGWRGTAALVVCLYHLGVLGTFYDVSLVRNGGYFVEFFFVLSGFVLAHAYASALRDRISLAAFIVRRVGRLWPLHAFTLGLLVAYEVVKWSALRYADLRAGAGAFVGETGLYALALNTFLLHGLGTFPMPTWNVPSWSISAEFFTYLLFGWICFRVYGRLSLAALAIALMAGALAAFLLQVQGAAWLRAAFPICVCNFFLGVAAYGAFRQIRSRVRLPWAYLEIVALLLIGLAFEFAWLHELVIVLPLLFAAIIIVFAFEEGQVSRVLCTGVFQQLGKISYSIYLVHFVILTGLNGGSRVLEQILHRKLRIGMDVAGRPVDVLAVGPLWAGDLVALCYIAAVVGVATATYHFVERPWQKRFDAWAFRMQQARRLTAHVGQGCCPRSTEDARSYP